MIEIVQKNSKWLLFEGIIFVVFGILAIALPNVFTLSLELIIGWLFLIGGAVQLVRCFQLRHAPGFPFSLINALLSVIVGILLVANPLGGVLTLTALMAIFFIIEGITEIGMAIKFRQLKNWNWLFFDGILVLIMAFIIISGWPQTASWVIGLLVGINMLFFGFSMISIALAANKQ